VPDENSDFAKGSIELLKILMLTGAIVGIFSVFQLWFASGEGFQHIEYSGIDFFLRNHTYGGRAYPDTGYFLYMPLIVLVASVAAVFIAALSFTKHEKKSAVAGIIVGALIVAAVLLYILYPEREIWMVNSAAIIAGPVLLRDSLGEGVYSAIIGGIFLIVGGLVILINRKVHPITEEEE